MLVPILLYLTLSLAIVAALCTMILRIGTLMSDCPGGHPGARTAALTIATGFAATGAGGATLIGALLPLFGGAPALALCLALGLAALCLGLGFTHAAATLRAMLNPAPPAKGTPEPAT